MQTFCYLDAFAAYTAATGAVQDNEFTGLLQLTEAQFNSLQSLFFTIGSVSKLLP